MSGSNSKKRHWWFAGVLKKVRRLHGEGAWLVDRNPVDYFTSSPWQRWWYRRCRWLPGWSCHWAEPLPGLPCWSSALRQHSCWHSSHSHQWARQTLQDKRCLKHSLIITAAIIHNATQKTRKWKLEKWKLYTTFACSKLYTPQKYGRKTINARNSGGREQGRP